MSYGLGLNRCARIIPSSVIIILIIGMLSSCRDGHKTATESKSKISIDSIKTICVSELLKRGRDTNDFLIHIDSIPVTWELIRQTGLDTSARREPAITMKRLSGKKYWEVVCSIGEPGMGPGIVFYMDPYTGRIFAILGL
jgi:hypothetical protein